MEACVLEPQLLQEKGEGEMGMPLVVRSVYASPLPCGHWPGRNCAEEVASLLLGKQAWQRLSHSAQKVSPPMEVQGALVWK